MKLSIAYSPCPNDTYAFHAMVHNLIDCEGLSFEVTMADVEQLNQDAALGKYDVCKLSYHAFFLLAKKYAMLKTGSALGYGNGPLLVGKKEGDAFLDSGEPNFNLIYSQPVAIPGEHTTAALLLKIAFPAIKIVEPMLFSNIENSVLTNNYLTGVLIHEGRFTYQQKGLQLIADLGDLWHQMSNLPIPLGGIAVSRRLDLSTAQKFERVLRRSLEFANNNPNASSYYVCNHAQEIEHDIVEKHIKMFVNEQTLRIDQDGEKAVYALFKHTLSIYPQLAATKSLFIL